MLELPMIEGKCVVIYRILTFHKAASLRRAVDAVDLYGLKEGPGRRCDLYKEPSLNEPLPAKPFRCGHDPDDSFCIAEESK